MNAVNAAHLIFPQVCLLPVELTNIVWQQALSSSEIAQCISLYQETMNVINVQLLQISVNTVLL
jgi:hypothetical protein